MATIDQNAELHAARTAVGEECVEGGADRTTGKENIVDEDDVFVFDVDSKIRFLYDRSRSEGGQIVTVEGDVESADGNRLLFHPSNELGQALSDRHTTPPDAYQSQVLGAVVFFHNLMSQTNERTLDFGCGHELRLLAQS